MVSNSLQINRQLFQKITGGSCLALATNQLSLLVVLFYNQEIILRARIL